MEIKIDPNWLREKATQENGCIISVGGLIAEINSAEKSGANMDHNEFNEKCKLFAEIKMKRDALKREATKLQAELDDLLPQLHEAYEDLEIGGPVGLKGLGKKLVFKETYRAKVINNDEFLEWLDQEGLGDMAERKVVWNRLDSLCKERIENKVEIPKGVDGSYQKQISLNAL